MKFKLRRGGAGKRRLRRVEVVPALFTLANGVCGFAAIVFASRIHPEALLEVAKPAYAEALGMMHLAGWMIFLGMVFDVLDGRVARRYNAASRFGAELDSLCDVVSFGVAPAFLLLKMGPTRGDLWWLYKLVFVAAGLYMVGAIVRLARFNVETTADEESHRFFKGLPSPAAAGCLASFAVLRHDLFDHAQLEAALRPWIDGLALAMPFGAIALAGLMVSDVRYPHLVNQSLRGRQPFGRLVTLLALAAFAAIFLTGLALALAFWGFAAFGALRCRPLPTAVEATDEREAPPAAPISREA